MNELMVSVKDGVGIITAAIGGLFFIGFVYNLAQAQMSNLTGDTMGRARAVQQGITLVIFLCIAVLVNPVTEQLQTKFDQHHNSRLVATNQVFNLWEDLVKFLVYLIIGVTITVLGVGAVYNGVGLQISRAVGLPADYSRSIGNLITIIIGIVLTLLSITMADSLVHLAFEHAIY